MIEKSVQTYLLLYLRYMCTLRLIIHDFVNLSAFVRYQKVIKARFVNYPFRGLQTTMG